MKYCKALPTVTEIDFKVRIRMTLSEFPFAQNNK